jgi:hypothetical protein
MRYGNQEEMLPTDARVLAEAAQFGVPFYGVLVGVDL